MKKRAVLSQLHLEGSFLVLIPKGTRVMRFGGAGKNRWTDLEVDTLGLLRSNQLYNPRGLDIDLADGNILRVSGSPEFEAVSLTEILQKRWQTGLFTVQDFMQGGDSEKA